MMDDISRGQVKRNAAEIYDQFFLPALFQEWPPYLLETAQIESGQRVLDVACGTGVLAIAAAEQVGPQGKVVGLDINEGMLEVARGKSEHIDWRHSQAEALPFSDASFDAVLCQFALMFFDDREAAVREMVRVLQPGGWLAVAVWDTLDNTPGYAAVTELLQRLFGDQAAKALRAPYNLGNTTRLRSYFQEAGLHDLKIETKPGTARFPSVESWLFTDVYGWTLAGLLDKAQFDMLQQEARRELKQFVQADGTVSFRAPAHIVSGQKT
jgi:ubiquinone/menaquinone biosynthesis C-methylase UbiE